MGMDIIIYTKGVSEDLIPQIKKRFSDFNMDVEFHPEFKFDEDEDTGFLPIKLNVRKGHAEQYDKIDYEIMTGFELLFSDYDYNQDLENTIQENAPTERKSFLSKLFGISKKATPAANIYVVDEQIDKLLKHCKKDIMLNWKSWNKSKLRISLFFAAIVAELTDGVIYDPQSGNYFNAQQALQEFPLEIEEYEQSLSDDEFTVDKFEGWI